MIFFNFKMKILFLILFRTFFDKIRTFFIQWFDFLTLTTRLSPSPKYTKTTTFERPNRQQTYRNIHGKRVQPGPSSRDPKHNNLH